jgi:hypothetical protein
MFANTQQSQHQAANLVQFQLAVRQIQQVYHALANRGFM